MTTIVTAGSRGTNLRKGTLVGPAPDFATINSQLGAQHAIVHQINRKTRRANTAAAYDPKAEEWGQFVDTVYCSQHASIRYTVTSEKLYRFLFYHAFRNKYNRKRKHGSGKTNMSKHGFNYEDYTRVVGTYTKAAEAYAERVRTKLVDADVEQFEPPEPDDPVGYDQINTYLFTVQNIFKQQLAANSNNLAWEHVRTSDVEALLKMVKNRRARIAKERYEEKLGADFTPYAAKDQLPIIEQKMWEDGCKNTRTAYSTLKHRQVVLSCYSGVLRHESMYNGELSDLLCVSHKDNRSLASEQFIQVMQMGRGKTVHEGGKKQYGRCTRNKDVKVCGVGAMGFYLLLRFEISGEMDEGKRPNFAINKEWFDIKILAEGTRGSNNKNFHMFTSV